MSWLLKFSISSLLVIFTVPFSQSMSVGQVTSEFTIEDRLNAASLFEGTFSNALSIQRGDFLLRVTKRFDSTKMVTPTDTLIVEDEKYFRVRFDHISQQTLAVRLYKNSLLHEPLNNESELSFDEGQSAAGLLFNGDQMFTRRLPDKLVKLQEDAPRAKILSMIGIPEIRAVGMVTFGGTGQFAQAENAIERLGSGDSISGLSKLINGKQTIELEVSRAEMKQTFAMVFRMDAERMLPLQREILLKTKTKRSMISEEKIDWVERDGVYLPSKILKRNNSQKVHKGMTYFSVVDTTAALHWFSVNKPFKADAYDKSYLEDTDKMMKLVDVVASKATTLLEADKSKENENKNTASSPE
ncbi:hypothetical protein [Mariniblastus fucicola]|uniref:Uncharacterized protein n=1 Tax=Mariniblastus fucicola TaxID=980251 RepID=A0A5B9PLH2_9BACT|nr:hypothetical protein [Mariniblastus fucicola]QEG23521.1 hypothetical protein MFFC18_34210 [Mariniblastus fucicola]